jgi:crotonobetainyl-CoA:carnitine CoA-transferase CaiB-like acyl-CoA transferase
MAPLSGVRVLDFSTLLPGPFATLILAEAGAEVIKVERPGGGDEMRNREPRLGPDSATFALLNRGKRSIAVDLKDSSARACLTPLIEAADVLVEQFRPGVMDRLGLGYDAVRSLNRRLIYCSLSGYGQSGLRAQLAGHDINYLADSGLLSLVSGRDGTPALPAVPLADIAGGSYPLVINILLALLQRARTGEGCHLDIAMADNVMCLGYWALARGLRSGEWPQPDGDTITGARARYRNYRARDGRFIAVGALEEKFWRMFCDIIDLPDDLRDDRRTPEQSIRGVAERLAAQDSSYWERAFAGRDICCTVVRTMEEAVRSPAAAERGLLKRPTTAGDDTMPALPIPLADALRSDATSCAAPPLGEGNGTLIAEP